MSEKILEVLHAFAGGDIFSDSAAPDAKAMLEQLGQERRRALDAEAEVTRLRQGLWDCYAAAGGDTDGDETPAALVGDIVALAVECVKDSRKDAEARVAELEGVLVVLIDTSEDLLRRLEVAGYSTSVHASGARKLYLIKGGAADQKRIASIKDEIINASILD